MQRPVLLILVVAVLALGCQRAPLPTDTGEAPAAAPAVSAAAEATAEGHALMQAGDHAAASEKYRRAVVAEPGVASHRFALASAYTFLRRQADAIEQFREVIRQADPGSDEYRLARRWLASAGVAIEAAAPVAPAAAPEESPAPPAPVEAALVGGRLVGGTQWPGIDPKVRAVSGEMSLAGIEPSTESVKRFRPLRLGARYQFNNLPPGKYRLVVKMAHHPEDVTLWDQRVTVLDGTPTELDLSPATARLSPDVFPPPAKD